MRADRIALLALLLALLGAGGGCADTGGEGVGSEAQTSSAGTTGPVDAPPRPTLGEAPTERPPVRLQVAPGVRLTGTARAQLEAAARRFGLSLTRWLYGERKGLDVGPLASSAGRELAASPPYIPGDQRGTDQGRVQRLEVGLQTTRSGIVTVTINDLRTSYRIPAGFELRGGRWQIVHFNSD